MTTMSYPAAAVRAERSEGRTTRDTSTLESTASAWAPRVLSILRIVTGLVFMTAGTMKLFGYPASPVPMPPIHPWSEMWLAGVLETFGGLAIVLGLFTRPVAFILSGEMAVAYFQFQAPISFFPTSNGGVPAVLYCFLYLFLSFAGAGPWSLDALLASRRAGHQG